MRNPKWHRDEILLALDLYFSPERGSIDAKNPKIQSLSAIINALPLFPDRPDAEKFRNPNGVALKLANFMSLDPSYAGKGMSRLSKLDEQIFKQYQFHQDKLRFLAREIRAATEDEQLKRLILQVETDETALIDSVVEGQVIYKLHKVRERDPAIVKAKKEQAVNHFGKLECEVCVFEFGDFYGEIGRGYIECHHRLPLHRLTTRAVVTLDDLALVCSNCHRMLHRKIDLCGLEELKSIVRDQRM